MSGCANYYRADGRARTPSNLVTTSEGIVQGYVIDGVAVFKGVHYGADTGGAGRFERPRAPARWDGVRPAIRFGPRAPHLPTPVPKFIYVDDPNVPENEDCLVLNIWTPGVDRALRPVMVWIHGGGFAFGDGGVKWYEGENLARENDVVVVTLNHRLNVFGFLHLAGLDERFADAGNAGMLDLIRALEWLRENIATFGGDPGNVTLFGESGGGAKISTLMGMPAAAGLFHKAIVQSGSALRAMSGDAATEAARQFIRQCGLREGEVARLQHMPQSALLAALAVLEEKNQVGRMFAPVVDGAHLPRDPFEPSAPAAMANVAMIIGTTQDEATVLLGSLGDHVGGPFALFLSEQELLQAVARLTGLSAEESSELVTVYRRARPHAKPRDLLYAIGTDRLMRMNAIAQAERKVEQGGAPVFMYIFAWEQPVFFGLMKAGHGVDVAFSFNNVDYNRPMLGDGADRYEIARNWSKALACFARSGSPNHDGLPQWPAYEADRRATMIVDRQCRVENDPGGAEREALRHLGPSGLM
ncbi:MAG: carboxylesterase family protein [Hyphomonadaceae bacterium]|nr:carboxylesterase family protein [Hyphomonadaceae bacterium]